MDRAPASGAGCVGSIPIRRTRKTPDEHYVLRGSFVVLTPLLTPLFENEVSGAKNQFQGMIGFSIF